MASSPRPARSVRRHEPQAGSRGAVFAPDRTHLISAAVMTGIMLLVIGHKPLMLSPLLIFPALFVAWVLRSRTTVTGDTISTRYLCARSTTTRWESVAGIRFRGAKACLVTTGDKEIVLPGVSFNDVSRLAAISQGRIPDVIEEGKQAADGKVVIIHQDGRQVLVDKDSPEAVQAAKKAEAAAKAAEKARARRRSRRPSANS